ncbi:hypothetical protein CYMTET_50294 [Cymbomonas tetramitiformis]|uniref:RCC1-like domain-containing protein n=1 Tax=Cymbomonas tetramitiformis TaxID=36881 RepID=A0AAE0BPM5_9CHLO|nr:hypothetical protein CYMTET_50294 [Cymbomonas tetramitiformis]
MALAAERAKYGLPAEFKVTREMKKNFTKEEKLMYKTAYEIGGVKRANDVMKAHFARQKAAAKAAEAAEGGTADAPAAGEAGGGGTVDGGGAKADPSGGSAVAAPPPQSLKPKELTVIPYGESSPAGQLLVAGTTDWENIGKKAPSGQCLYSFHRIMDQVQIRFVTSGSASVHSLAVDEAGVAYTWGRNDAGQLGHGNYETYYTPAIVQGLKGHAVRHASCGKRHTVVVTTEGKLFSWGSHKTGALGTGGAVKEGFATPQQLNVGEHEPFTRVSCGAEFTMAVNEEGLVFAWGHPMYGQLGNGSNGEVIERANTISYHFVTAPQIVRFDVGHCKAVDVACGNNHTVVLSEEGRVYTWGFAGYGRLGHSNQNDLMAPAELSFFNGGDSKPRMCAKNIAAGATASYCMTRGGMTYFWGRTKSTGEANMYPKPVYDLNGWNVRSISCGNTSTICAADEAIITWGSSPTYGELGYGDPDTGAPKSSTVPKLVDVLQGVIAHTVSAGYAHTAIIASRTEGKGEALLSTLPIHESEPAPVKGAKKRASTGNEPETKKGRKK